MNEGKPKQTFVVARDRWLRGKLAYDADGNNQSALLNTDGLRCCLGFACSQIGIRDELLMGIGDPCSIEGALEAEDCAFFELVADDEDGSSCVSNTQLSDEAIPVNDDEQIDDSERERRLITIFAKHGEALEFVDTQAQLEARLAELRKVQP